MKRKFSKGLLLPMLTVVMGVAGAFMTTSAASVKPLSNVTGYRFVSATDPCHADIMCSNVFSANICTSAGIQLWDKSSATVCDIPLYRKLP